MNADNSVHFAKDIPQWAANLYVDSALSMANMAQVVFALEKLSGGGIYLKIEPKLLDAYHQMINKMQGNIFGREWEQVRCQWQCIAYDEYVERLCETMLSDTH